MTFLAKLQAHKGGLIRLKNQLYWYGRGLGWDRTPGRACLLLDSDRHVDSPVDITGLRPAACTPMTDDSDSSSAQAHLLIDGQLHWVWIAEEDVELL